MKWKKCIVFLFLSNQLHVISLSVYSKQLVNISIKIYTEALETVKGFQFI